MGDRQNRAQSESEQKKWAIQITEKVAAENLPLMSNGNRWDLDESQLKIGDAQHGGPDIDKARARQPPDAIRARRS